MTNESVGTMFTVMYCVRELLEAKGKKKKKKKKMNALECVCFFLFEKSWQEEKFCLAFSNGFDLQTID